MSGQDDDWEEKTDLTRIEDLSDFLHEEDPELDDKLEHTTGTEAAAEELPDLDDLEDDLTPEIPVDDQDSFASENDDEEVTTFEDKTEDAFELPSDFNENHNDSEETEELQDGDLEDTSLEGIDFATSETSVDDSVSSFASEMDSVLSNDDDQDDFSSDNHAFTSGEDSTENNFSDEQETFEETEEIVEDLPVKEESVAPVASQPPENFSDVKEFGNNITYGTVSSGGNPPFSIIIRNIKYSEDAEDIMSLLKEYGIVTPETEQTTKQGLDNGNLLISQISEYSAIFIAHKLRRFDLDMRIGLSDQLHSSKSYQGNSKGLVSKQSLTQNKREEEFLKGGLSTLEDVVLLPGQADQGYHIKRYFDLVTSHTLILEDELSNTNLSKVQYSKEMGSHYQTLANELKEQAFRKGANAVNDIHFTLSPSPKENKMYKLSCIGHAIWAVFTES